MSTILNPDPVTADRAGGGHAVHADAVLWRVAAGSHVAISTDHRSRASAVAVHGGFLEIDAQGDVATLEIALAGGMLRGTGALTSAGLVAFDVWTIHGSLVLDGRTTRVTLALRDHGVVHRRGTWRWLSGTGSAPRCGRTRRRAAGAPLVADLLFRA